jgi:methenyltetrahydromethanopterin cyclohydrolase
VVTGNGWQAGLVFAGIKYGGLAQLSITWSEELQLPLLTVWTEHPLPAITGSLWAEGWKLPARFRRLLGKGPPAVSGPIKSLARKPLQLFRETGYQDSSKKSIAIVQLDRKPIDQLPLEQLAEYLAAEAGLDPNDLYLMLAFGGTEAGALTILSTMLGNTVGALVRGAGYDLHRLKRCFGTVPIIPTTSDPVQSLYAVNNALMYTSHTTLYIEAPGEDIAHLAESLVLEKAFSKYGALFEDLFEKADSDWNRFNELYWPWRACPPRLTVIEEETGRVHSAGRIRMDIIRRILSRRKHAKRLKERFQCR